MAYDGKASVRAESPRFRNRQSPKLAKPHHAGGGGGKEPALRGVNAQRGTSAATTGPRGARSTPKRGSPRGVGSAPPNPLRHQDLDILVFCLCERWGCLRAENEAD